MVLFTNPIDALTLKKNGLDYNYLNVSGMRFNDQRTRLHKNMSVTGRKGSLRGTDRHGRRVLDADDDPRQQRAGSGTAEELSVTNADSNRTAMLYTFKRRRKKVCKSFRRYS
ncbi:MAG: hypothetical protein ACLVJ6_02635 [Merdibacter sp.]